MLSAKIERAVSFWVDGKKKSEVDIAGTNLADGFMRVGNARVPSPQFFNGLLGELVIMSGDRAIGLAADVDTALMARWSIP